MYSPSSIGENVDCRHRVVDRRDIVAVWAIPRKRGLPCIGWVLWTLESLLMLVSSKIKSQVAVLSLLTLTRIMMTVYTAMKTLTPQNNTLFMLGGGNTLW